MEIEVKVYVYRAEDGIECVLPDDEQLKKQKDILLSYIPEQDAAGMERDTKLVEEKFQALTVKRDEMKQKARLETIKLPVPSFEAWEQAHDCGYMPNGVPIMDINKAKTRLLKAALGERPMPFIQLAMILREKVYKACDPDWSAMGFGS